MTAKRELLSDGLANVPHTNSRHEARAATLAAIHFRGATPGKPDTSTNPAPPASTAPSSGSPATPPNNSSTHSSSTSQSARPWNSSAAGSTNSSPASNPTKPTPGSAAASKTDTSPSAPPSTASGFRGAAIAAADAGDTRTFQQRRADACTELLLGKISNGCHVTWEDDEDDDEDHDNDESADHQEPGPDTEDHASPENGQ